MQKSIIFDTAQCLFNKLDLLKKYQGITEELITAEFDDITQLLSDRQDIINSINNINNNIYKIIDEADIESKEILDIIKFRCVSENNKYKEICEISDKIRENLLLIKQLEKQAGLHLAALSCEIRKMVKQGKLNRQTVNYCNVLTGIPHKGKIFDSLS